MKRSERQTTVGAHTALCLPAPSFEQAYYLRDSREEPLNAVPGVSYN